MPALQLADTPMHSSSPHYPHFHIHPQASHASSSSPLSSPCSACINSASAACPVILPCSDDDHHPPDLACTLRFGDIPAASSFGAGVCSTSGLMQSPPTNLQQLLGSSSSLAPAESLCSTKAEVKLLNRSQSKLSRQSTPPMRGIGKDLEEGVTHTEGPCCTEATGLCASGANCAMGSPRLSEALLALQKFLPSNNFADEEDDDEEIWAAADSWPALDVYSCDDFRMFEFKVRKCVRGRSHDWTECPFAHPGEKARRRDPRRYRYSGTACPDFRKGNCRRGEACEYSHGVFECWLHPMRYRTQPCKDGKGCRRRVCFFAHTPEQLRVVPTEGESPPTTPGSCGSSSSGSTRSNLLKAAALSGGAYDGSPLRRALAGTLDGTMALELFLDDASNKSVPAGACTHHHHHHHWIGMGSSPSSTLVGFSACATSPSPMSSPVLSPASPLVSNSGVPAHRRHLDRLRSIPTLSIPVADDTSIGSPPQGSPRTMAELMSTLQISPSAMTVQSCRTLPSASSTWPLLSKLQHAPSAPNTPKPRYGHPINMMQINAGPELPSCSPYALVKPVTGRSTSSTATVVVSAVGGEIQPPAVDSEVPDLEWVNELVQ